MVSAVACAAFSFEDGLLLLLQAKRNKRTGKWKRQTCLFIWLFLSELNKRIY
jgi:hypothetical protein